MTSQIQLEIAKQINAKELKFANFKLMTEKENSVIVRKGQKAIKITYNSSSDEYDLEYMTWGKDYNVKRREVHGIYFDQLQGIIEQFFNFQYVMARFGL